MKRVSRRLGRIPASATLAINTRARELAAQGKDVISFAAGEPDFATPEHIVEAAIIAARDPVNHHYTQNAGLPPLREAVAEYTAQYSGVDVEPAQTLITNGGKQAIFQALAALVDPGDEVLVPTPYWVTYPAAIELAGGTTVPVPSSPDQGFKVTVDDLEAALTDRSAALIFVSPSNPSGTVYDAAEAQAIGEWARDRGIWVIADEIYQRLVYETDVAPSIAAVTPDFDRWILVNGVAKSFAMTGWRVGWMVGPSDIVDAAARHQSHATSNVANVSQRAALAALTGPQEPVEEMRQAFARRRELMHSLVSAIEGFDCVKPQGAFYLFPEVTAALGERFPDAAALARGILDEAGVALVPGDSFGSPGFMRFSYALGEEDIERGMARMARLFEGL